MKEKEEKDWKIINNRQMNNGCVIIILSTNSNLDMMFYDRWWLTLNVFRFARFICGMLVAIFMSYSLDECNDTRRLNYTIPTHHFDSANTHTYMSRQRRRQRHLNETAFTTAATSISSKPFDFFFYFFVTISNRERERENTLKLYLNVYNLTSHHRRGVQCFTLYF